MPRPRSDIQPRIIEAARARFLAQGVDGASLREIARDARTNIGMVVYYFPTKDDLFLSVVEDVYAGLVSDLSKILEAEGPAFQRLRGGILRLGTASDLEMEVMQLVFREGLSSSTRLSRILARFMRGHVPILMSTFVDGVRNGELDGSLPAPFLLLAVMGLGGIPQLARRASKKVPVFQGLPEPEALADLSIRALQRAVGVPSAPSLNKRARPIPKPKTRAAKRSR